MHTGTQAQVSDAGTFCMKVAAESKQPTCLEGGLLQDLFLVLFDFFLLKQRSAVLDVGSATCLLGWTLSLGGSCAPSGALGSEWGGESAVGAAWGETQLHVCEQRLGTPPLHVASPS